MFEGGTPAFAGGSIVDAAVNTIAYSAIAAAAATLLALPVALLAARYQRRGVRILERSTFLILAMPGLVVALALSYFSEHWAHGFAYQSAPMVVVAYVMLFFPLALVGVRASAAFAPVSLEQAASSLGQGRFAVFRRVTLPLLAPGLATGFLPRLRRGRHRAHGHADLDPDGQPRRWPRSSGPMRRTCPTVRPLRTRSS